MSADDYPVTSAIACLTLRAAGASSFLARIQRRFTLLGCRMTPNGKALETAWDVSNPEGTKLEPTISEALNTFVGVDDATACPGSIRAEAPAGMCLAGPRIDAALALELLPLEQAARAAMEAKSKKAAAAAAAAASKLEAQKKKTDTGKQGAAAKEPKAKGGAATGEAKPQLCAVELQRPSAPNGEWLHIRVLRKEAGGSGNGGGGSAAATGKDTGASTKKGGSGSEGTSSAASAKKMSAAPPATTSGGGGGVGVGGGGVATEPGAGTTTVAAAGNVIVPHYRSTRETAAMQQALLHAAAGGHAEQAYLFHSGRLPWHAAIEGGS